MKNVFYFMLKPLFVLKIFISLSWLFGDVGKQQKNNCIGIHDIASNHYENGDENEK